MSSYKVQCELKTDTFLGNGHSLPGYIDSDVCYDKNGFVYMNAKTFKGKLVEMVDIFLNVLKDKDRAKYEYFKDIRNKLFGVEGEISNDCLRFERLTIPKVIKDYFLKLNISSEEMIEALTHVEVETSIDDKGIAKDNTLRSYRVINRGIELESNITSENKLSKDELGLLCLGLGMLKHIGGKETKGKGYVSFRLFEDEKDCLNTAIEELRKQVES